MITEKYALDEKLEQLRQETYPPLWNEIVPKLSEPTLENLENTLRFLQDCHDFKIRQDAIQIIQDYLSIEVDPDPEITLSFY
jgi:hypothetical protein